MAEAKAFDKVYNIFSYGININILLVHMGNILKGSNFNENEFKFNIVQDKKTAETLLDNAELTDLYIEECNDHRANFLARKNLSYATNSISSGEYKYAVAHLNMLKATIPIRLVNDLKAVTIIQLMPTADGGMPHTRPNNIICYPDFRQLLSRTTLIHELWHVHQRLFKDAWFRMFNSLGWTMWNDELPEHLEKARRFNPDTIDCPLWIFENQWIPIPIFKDISKPKVGDVEIWFYNPRLQYHIKHVPDTILSYFPDLPPTAYEHPRELTAYLLAEPELHRNNKGFIQLIELIGNISIMSYKSVYNIPK